MSYHRYRSVLSVNVSHKYGSVLFVPVCIGGQIHFGRLSVSVSMVIDMGWHFLSPGQFFFPWVSTLCSWVYQWS